jgi:hypothetical protein
MRYNSSYRVRGFRMVVVLAHGSLGAFDEILYLGVAAIFLVMMGISWMRSRYQPPRLDDPDETTTTPNEPDAPERFKLE